MRCRKDQFGTRASLCTLIRTKVIIYIDKTQETQSVNCEISGSVVGEKKISGLLKGKVKKRIREYLALVGLSKLGATERMSKILRFLSLGLR